MRDGAGRAVWRPLRRRQRHSACRLGVRRKLRAGERAFGSQQGGLLPVARHETEGPCGELLRLGRANCGGRPNEERT